MLLSLVSADRLVPARNQIPVCTTQIAAYDSRQLGLDP